MTCSSIVIPSHVATRNLYPQQCFRWRRGPSLRSERQQCRDGWIGKRVTHSERSEESYISACARNTHKFFACTAQSLYKSLRDFHSLPCLLHQKETKIRSTTPMLAAITLYTLWIFMTVFMLAVVFAGGRSKRPRRVPAVAHAPRGAGSSQAVSFNCEPRG